MNHLSFAGGIGLVMLLVANASAQAPSEPAKAVTIPLKDVWALRGPWSVKAPETRDIRKLDEELTKQTGSSALNSIIEKLLEAPSRPQNRNSAGPGFAVIGRDVDALLAAKGVVVDGVKPRDSFSVGNDISLVFYSHPRSGVDVQEVARRGNDISIRYRFVGYVERYVSLQFALIPLGPLPAGKYHVSIIQTQPVQKFRDEYKPVKSCIDLGLGLRIVSGDFSFNVEETNDK
jgi:hypothetical protein